MTGCVVHFFNTANKVSKMAVTLTGFTRALMNFSFKVTYSSSGGFGGSARQGRLKLP